MYVVFFSCLLLFTPLCFVQCNWATKKKKKWFQNQIESTVINCSVIFVVVVVRSRWLFASCLVHFAKYHNEHHAVAEYHAHKNVLPVFGFFFSFFLAVVVILLHLFVSQRHTAVYVMSDRANCFYCRPQTKRWKQNKTKNEYNNSIFGCNHNKKAKNGKTQKKSNEEFAKRTHKYIYVMCKFPLRPQIVYLLHEWFVCVFFLLLLLLALPSLLNSPQMHVSTAAVGSDNRRTHTAHSSLSLGMWKVKATAIFIFKSSGAMWWWPNAIGRPHRYFKW